MQRLLVGLVLSNDGLFLGRQRFVLRLATVGEGTIFGRAIIGSCAVLGRTLLIETRLGPVIAVIDPRDRPVVFFFLGLFARLELRDGRIGLILDRLASLVQCVECRRQRFLSGLLLSLVRLGLLLLALLDVLGRLLERSLLSFLACLNVGQRGGQAIVGSLLLTVEPLPVAFNSSAAACLRASSSALTSASRSSAACFS